LRREKRGKEGPQMWKVNTEKKGGVDLREKAFFSTRVGWGGGEKRISEKRG